MPVDLLPAAATQPALEPPARIVPSTDLNVDLRISMTVLLLIIFYSVKMKGLVGFIAS